MESKEPPKPWKLNPLQWDERREFISEYLKFIGGDESTKWNGRLKVADLWLEYEVDRLAWGKLFSEHRDKVIEWPWQNKILDPNDISYGVSPTYQKWRLDRGLPICDSPKVFGNKKARILSLCQRQVVWSKQNSHGKFETPTTGPFQIALPAWVDVHTLFFGEGDYLLDMINSDIIPRHLVVSWHNEDKPYITLVVGLEPTECVDPKNEQVQLSLKYLWQGVVHWVTGAYYGGTMTLATFLHVHKVIPVADDINCRYGWLAQMAYESFGQVQDDIPFFVKQASENREFMAQSRTEVHEILQKPLAEAKGELSSWVLRDVSAFDDRVEAAKEIWVSGTTDEKVIEEACLWAWGQHHTAV
ncbi:hypothetical protein FBEOM_3283 [Fusarium beomiforme]|uniref:Uncharacterized protein n=1 Tax=Fusarium beomiforme TaxID=44412 RepID=A0A9P5DZB8_9HYPO|nr:hypothetical protein FBEOM_3283 [Fusarium beomiforme]